LSVLQGSFENLQKVQSHAKLFIEKLNPPEQSQDELVILLEENIQLQGTIIWLFIEIIDARLYQPSPSY